MMKIIESSIKIIDPIGFDCTIFNCSDLQNQHYVDIGLLSGKNCEIEFRYLDNISEKKTIRKLKIPRGLNETAVKNYILVMLIEDAKIYT